MSRRRRQNDSNAARWKRVLAWTAGALLMLLVGGFFLGRMWIDRYLKSERFRAFVAAKVGKSLNAEAEVGPLKWTSGTVYGDYLRARGSERSPFSELSVERVRAELNTRRVFDGVWQVDGLEIGRVRARLDGPKVVLPETPRIREEAVDRQKEQKPSSSWLPNRLELSSATIRDITLEWGEGEKAGAIERTNIKARPQDGTWLVEGWDGKLRHGTLPVLDVSDMNLRVTERSLFINSADFRQGANGRVNVSGEAHLDDRVDVAVKFSGINMEPLLAEDWRYRLRGELGGDVRVRTKLPLPDGGPEVNGTVTVVNGRLEALPLLDQIARFTRVERFRILNLTKVESRFTRTANGVLRFEDFVGESEGLMRVEGRFQIANGQIDGTFQVGVIPSSLAWLSPVTDRVFTEARGGYVWTSMRLTGPAESPKEDLTPRLMVATGEAVVEKVEDTVRDAVEVGKDLLKTGADLLFKGPLGR